MKTTVNSGRRGFLWKAGAALSAPLAAVATSAHARAYDDRDALHARLALLEDVNAIRDLNRRYVQHVNAGAHDEAARLFAHPASAHVDGARRLAADSLGGGEDAIEIAADADTATSLLHCTAQTETPIEPVTPLVEMARAQGGGVARRSERGVLEGTYVKRAGSWKIERLVFRAT
jgi:hypothetical protein